MGGSSPLKKELAEEKLSEYYTDILALTRKIFNYIVKSKTIKERFGDVMGGKILELQSEKDRRIGKELRDREKIAEMLKRGKSSEDIHDFCGYPMDLILEVEKEMLVEA